MIDGFKSQVQTGMESVRSFPFMHKVGNIGIFVQLLVEINWKQKPAE